MPENPAENTSILSESLSKNVPLFWAIALQMGVALGFLYVLLVGPDADALDWWYTDEGRLLFYSGLGALITFDVKVLLIIGIGWFSELE
jgi:hypothetical protein